MKETTYIKPKMNVIIDIPNLTDENNDIGYLNNNDIGGELSGGGFDGGMDE